jgi:hypothetical protein
MSKIIAHGDNRNAWLIGTDVFIAPANAPLDIDGNPMGSRWECSKTHFDRYRETVFHWLKDGKGDDHG